MHEENIDAQVNDFTSSNGEASDTLIGVLSTFFWRLWLMLSWAVDYFRFLKFFGSRKLACLRLSGYFIACVEQSLISRHLHTGTCSRTRLISLYLFNNIDIFLSIIQNCPFLIGKRTTTKLFIGPFSQLDTYLIIWSNLPGFTKSVGFYNLSEDRNRDWMKIMRVMNFWNSCSDICPFTQK